MGNFHFWGSTHGNAGQATRVGSKTSGQTSYAQSNYSRVTVDFRHLGNKRGATNGVPAERDDIAHITIGAGHTTYYRDRSVSFNPNTVAEALDTGDPRIERIWNKIVKAFNELDEQAPIAVERVAKRKRREQTKQEREAKHKANMQGIIIATMSPEEKARCVKLLSSVELDSNGDFEQATITRLTDEAWGDLRKGEDGRHYINAEVYDGLGRISYPFDLTIGQWVLPFDPNDLGLMHEENLQRYGYRVEQEKAHA